MSFPPQPSPHLPGLWQGISPYSLPVLSSLCDLEPFSDSQSTWLAPLFPAHSHFIPPPSPEKQTLLPRSGPRAFVPVIPEYCDHLRWMLGVQGLGAQPGSQIIATSPEAWQAGDSEGRDYNCHWVLRLQDSLTELKRIHCSWLTPVILATWQAEIRRITVQA
jgi:hypothetical protein